MKARLLASLASNLANVELYKPPLLTLIKP